MSKYVFERLIENEKVVRLNSFEVLNIYFNQKATEDKQRILIDSAFGC